MSVHTVCLLVILCGLLNYAMCEDYKVSLEKVSACNDHSSSLADISALKVTKINSTSVVFRGHVTTNSDVSDGTTLSMVINKYSLGNWITIPFKFPPQNICEFARKDSYYFPILRKTMNLPSRCPFPQGKYQMNNAVLTIRKLPAYLPRGCFRIDATLKSKQLQHPSCYSVMARVTGPNDTPSTSCPRG